MTLQQPKQSNVQRQREKGDALEAKYISEKRQSPGKKTYSAKKPSTNDDSPSNKLRHEIKPSRLHRKNITGRLKRHFNQQDGFRSSTVHSTNDQKKRIDTN